MPVQSFPLDEPPESSTGPRMLGGAGATHRIPPANGALDALALHKSTPAFALCTMLALTTKLSPTDKLAAPLDAMAGTQPSEFGLAVQYTIDGSTPRSIRSA